MFCRARPFIARFPRRGRLEAKSTNKSVRETGIKSLVARVERLERAQFESFKRDVLAGVAQFERGEFEPFDATVYNKVIEEERRRKAVE
jgi:hypothetical protein